MNGNDGARNNRKRTRFKAERDVGGELSFGIVHSAGDDGTFCRADLRDDARELRLKDITLGSQLVQQGGAFRIGALDCVRLQRRAVIFLGLIDRFYGQLVALLPEGAAARAAPGAAARHLDVHPAEPVDIYFDPCVSAARADLRPFICGYASGIAERIARGDPEHAVEQRCGACVVLADPFAVFAQEGNHNIFRLVHRSVIFQIVDGGILHILCDLRHDLPRGAREALLGDDRLQILRGAFGHGEVVFVDKRTVRLFSLGVSGGNAPLPFREIVIGKICERIRFLFARIADVARLNGVTVVRTHRHIVGKQIVVREHFELDRGRLLLRRQRSSRQVIIAVCFIEHSAVVPCRRPAVHCIRAVTDHAEIELSVLFGTDAEGNGIPAARQRPAADHAARIQIARGALTFLVALTFFVADDLQCPPFEAELIIGSHIGARGVGDRNCSRVVPLSDVCDRRKIGSFPRVPLKEVITHAVQLAGAQFKLLAGMRRAVILPACASRCDGDRARKHREHSIGRLKPDISGNILAAVHDGDSADILLLADIRDA